MSLRFAAPAYANGRRVALSGSVEVGAVFPPIGERETKWTWRMFLHPEIGNVQGQAKSELAAKNGLAAAFTDFLRQADLEPKRETTSA